MFINTITLIKNDLDFYSTNKGIIVKIITFFLNISFKIIAIQRIISYSEKTGKIKTLAIFLQYYQRCISGCYIHPSVSIGTNLNLPHPTAIVVGKGVIIGDNVTIFQSVTLGSSGRKDEEKSYPTIMDNVTIYANSIIIGSVTIGSKSTIGAGSLVLYDIPEGSTAVGSPARILK